MRFERKRKRERDMSKKERVLHKIDEGLWDGLQLLSLMCATPRENDSYVRFYLRNLELLTDGTDTEEKKRIGLLIERGGRKKKEDPQPEPQVRKQRQVEPNDVKRAMILGLSETSLTVWLPIELRDFISKTNAGVLSVRHRLSPVYIGGNLKDLVKRYEKATEGLCHETMVSTPYLQDQLLNFYLPVIASMENGNTIESAFQSVVSESTSETPPGEAKFKHEYVLKNAAGVRSRDGKIYADTGYNEVVYGGVIPRQKDKSKKNKSLLSQFYESIGVTSDLVTENYKVFEALSENRIQKPELDHVNSYALFQSDGSASALKMNGIATWKYYKGHPIYGRCAYLDILCSRFEYDNADPKAKVPGVGQVLEDELYYEAYGLGYKVVVLTVVYARRSGSQTATDMDALVLSGEKQDRCRQTINFYQKNGFKPIGFKIEQGSDMQMIMYNTLSIENIKKIDARKMSYINPDYVFKHFPSFVSDQEEE